MGCILEQQIFSFGKMILRDRCNTSYDLVHFFVAHAVLWTDGMANCKTNWHQANRSSNNFLFLKHVSQDCFVLDVVKWEVSQKRLVSKLVDRQRAGQAGGQTDR